MSIHDRCDVASCRKEEVHACDVCGWVEILEPSAVEMTSRPSELPCLTLPAGIATVGTKHRTTWNNQLEHCHGKNPSHTEPPPGVPASIFRSAAGPCVEF